MADTHDLLAKAKAALAVVSVVCGLSAVGLSQFRMQQLFDQQEREADLRVATQCVASHERIAQIKDATESGLRGGGKVGAEAMAHALIQIGIEQGSPPQPGVEERFREILTEYVNTQSDTEVKRARGEIGTPECDLEAAKKLLEEES